MPAQEFFSSFGSDSAHKGRGIHKASCCLTLYLALMGESSIWSSKYTQRVYSATRHIRYPHSQSLHTGYPHRQSVHIQGILTVSTYTGYLHSQYRHRVFSQSAYRVSSQSIQTQGILIGSHGIFLS